MIVRIDRPITKLQVRKEKLFVHSTRAISSTNGESMGHTLFDWCRHLVDTLNNDFIRWFLANSGSCPLVGCDCRSSNLSFLSPFWSSEEVSPRMEFGNGTDVQTSDQIPMILPFLEGLDSLHGW